MLGLLAVFRLIFALIVVLNPALTQGAAHFALGRREGRLAHHSNIDLVTIGNLVRQTEARCGRTSREFKGNKLARRRHADTSGTAADVDLIEGPGQPGRWFFNLDVGDPVQSIQVDLDMLSPDFYTLMTTSESGSRYNSFSRSHVPNEHRVHPLCKLPTDNIHIASSNAPNSFPIQLPMCSPSKNSRYTTGPSGTVLGLAPSNTLTQISAEGLLHQLLEKQVIDLNLFSLTLLDAQTGKLSLGGTIAEEMEEAKTRFQVQFDNIENPFVTTDLIDSEVRERMSRSLPPALRDQFDWVDVHGAAGLWTTLMGGVWINGVKVLNNQPVMFDIQSPFIIAPPAAARRFYKGIHATKRLPKPHDNMFAFPCLNPPNIAFEFAQKLFPTLSGDVSMEERFDGPLGGKLSLGKLRDGTGYCLGVVVESRMGSPGSEEQGNKLKSRRYTGKGLDDLWIIGDPFFRGTGVAFDVGEQKIGFRIY